MRSKVTLRSKTRFSAGEAGANPFSSSFARRNASIGDFTQFDCFTAGTAGFLTGWKAQNLRPCVKS